MMGDNSTISSFLSPFLHLLLSEYLQLSRTFYTSNEDKKYRMVMLSQSVISLGIQHRFLNNVNVIATIIKKMAYNGRSTKFQIL